MARGPHMFASLVETSSAEAYTDTWRIPMLSSPKLIDETNLSRSWARALLTVLDNSRGDLAPLTVSIADFDDGLPVEDPRIRSALEESLTRSGKFSCDV